jgi:NAD(P)H-dependent FMN reductase
LFTIKKKKAMGLTIFIGSPRNKKSNSKILMEQFLKGYSKENSEDVQMHYLANINRMDENVKAFEDAQTVIVIFPLYTDCMPGIVKDFFEHVVHIANRNKRIGFIVQSGFPEGIHSSYVERYLEKFTKRLQYEYLGTVIKGGVEGIQIMPPMMTKKLFRNFEKLGEAFAQTGKFPVEMIENLKSPFKLSPRQIVFLSAGEKLGLSNYYWNSNLKKNGAFEIRFAKPYINIQ